MKVTEVIFNAKTGTEEIIERELTEQEIVEMEARQNQFELNNKLNKLTQNLIKTDYIANKLAEAVSKYISTGDNTDVLLLREKYALELVNREQWRKEVDKLQQELKLLDK